jgi:hypothetical protein
MPCFPLAVPAGSSWVSGGLTLALGDVIAAVKLFLALGTVAVVLTALKGEPYVIR